MSPALTAAVSLATSFLGSISSIILWFHFDLEDRWRHHKAEAGRRREEKEKEANERAQKAHLSVLREMRAEGLLD